MILLPAPISLIVLLQHVNALIRRWLQNCSAKAKPWEIICNNYNYNYNYNYMQQLYATIAMGNYTAIKIIILRCNKNYYYKVHLLQ